MKHKLLMAVDGEKTSWKTAIYVGRACAGSKGPFCKIVVFHVLSPLPTDAGVEPPDPQLVKELEKETRAAADKMLAEMKERIVREGVDPALVSTEVASERGHIAEQILQAAAAHECDTIAVGRRGSSMIREFFLGGVVEHLLRHPTGFSIWVVE